MKKRYYLTANTIFYGVIMLAGVKTILSTNNQGEANVTMEDDVDDTVKYLERHGINVVKREIPYQTNIGRRKNVLNQ